MKRAVGVLLVALCAACASTPPVRFHTLLPMALPQPADTATPAGRAQPTFVLESIKVPASVDQPQWLVRLPDQSLALLEQDRWASPLRDELRAALLERLRLRFGMLEARSPEERGAVTARIALELTRFESIPGRAVRVEANWTLTPTSGAASGARALRCSRLIEEPVAAGIAALAAGQRRVVARLGDILGEQLTVLQRGDVGHCAADAAAPSSGASPPQ